MTNIQGALGISQLSRIDEFIDERKRIQQRYDSILSSLGFQRPLPESNSKDVNWLYTVLVPNPINRDQLAIFLNKCGVETRPVFRPISSFSYIQKYGRSKTIFEFSDVISKRGISFPTFNGLKMSEINFITSCIATFSKNNNIQI